MKNGYSAKGIDLGSEYIEYGKKIWGLDLEVKTVQEVKETYDLIILNNVLEHIINIENFLSLVAEKLTPNGQLYIMLPGLHSTYKQYGTLIRSLQNAHVYYFSFTTLKNVMNKYGFELSPNSDQNEFIEGLWKYTGKKISSFTNDYLPIKINLSQIIPLQNQLLDLQKELAFYSPLKRLLKKIKSSFLYRVYAKMFKKSPKK